MSVNNGTHFMNEISSIKDQGTCGNDWALALTSQVESQFKKEYGQFLNLSSSQLMDCAHKGGCSEPISNPLSAVNYIGSKGL